MKRRYFLLFNIVILLFSLAFHFAFSTERQRPTANIYGVENLITEIFAKKIVSIEASKRWSEFAIGKAIYCCDDSDDLVAYMIPVKINDIVFPDDEMLFLNNEPNDNRNAINWQAGQYWTYVVSARERDFPIPCEFNTLPPLFVTYSRAQKVANDYLFIEDATMIKYYFLGHRGEYYKFEDPGHSKSILIHAYRITPFAEKEVLTRRGESEVTRAKKYNELLPHEKNQIDIYRDQVKQEWEKYRKLVKNKLLNIEK